MKKTVLLILLLLFGASTVWAAEKLEESFYVGQFKLNEANWTTEMDTQLLRGLSGLPDDFSIKVFGHTDESGPKDFNEKLAEKRADLVAGKIAKLYPGAKLSQKGVIFDPEKGQNTNFRMVRVTLSYEEESLIQYINSMNRQIKDSLGGLEKKIANIDFGDSFSSLEAFTRSGIAELESAGEKRAREQSQKQAEILGKINKLSQEITDFRKKEQSSEKTTAEKISELKSSFGDLRASIQKDLSVEMNEISKGQQKNLLAELEKKFGSLAEKQLDIKGDISVLRNDLREGNKNRLTEVKAFSEKQTKIQKNISALHNNLLEVNKNHLTEIKSFFADGQKPLDDIEEQLAGLQAGIKNLGSETLALKPLVEDKDRKNDTLIRNLLISFIIIQFITIAILIVCLASRKAFLELAGRDVK